VGRGRRRRLGQALPEFALVLPVLALILLGIIQMAFIFAAQVGITNAVREAARLAAVSTPTTTTGQAVGAGSAGEGVYDRLTDPATGFLKRNVFAYSPANLVESGAPETQICYRTFTDAAAKPAVSVKVEAHYRHPLFIPLVSVILDNLDGSGGDGLRVGASEEMRVENDELLAMPTGFPVCQTT
jgi:Flp pilus assembly protein TadG